MKQTIIRECAFDAVTALGNLHGNQTIYDALRAAFTGQDPNWEDEAHRFAGSPEKAVYAAIAPDIIEACLDDKDLIDIDFDLEFDTSPCQEVLKGNFDLDSEVMALPGDKHITLTVKDVETGKSTTSETTVSETTIDPIF